MSLMCLYFVLVFLKSYSFINRAAIICGMNLTPSDDGNIQVSKSCRLDQIQVFSSVRAQLLGTAQCSQVLGTTDREEKI